MKKCIFILTMGMIVSITLGSEAIAQMPKEGRFDVTNTYGGTQRVFPIDKDHYVIVFEDSGVIVAESGVGFSTE